MAAQALSIVHRVENEPGGLPAR